jgi:hypothetical protein
VPHFKSAIDALRKMMASRRLKARSCSRTNRTLKLLGKKLKLFVKRVEVENPQDEAYRLLLREIKERPQAK